MEAAAALGAWTEDKERALIAFFSQHSCLWNPKSKSYKDRQVRWKTLEHLRILLSAHPPPVPFTVDDIKNKFKNLRTTFQRQHKLVKAGAAPGSDAAFVSPWKHYQQMMFLQSCCDQEEAPDQPAGQQEQQEPVLPSPGLLISILPSSSSSCSSSGASAKCYWTEEKERELISFYAEHSCLWKKKCENRNNRQLRLRTLEALRVQLSERHPASFTVEDIKSKFKNLRTVFNREHKAVRASEASAFHRLYVSKWKHYQQLLFLSDADDPDPDPDPEDADGPRTLLTPQEEDVDCGERAPSSTLSGFPSGGDQSDVEFSTSTPPSFTPPSPTSAQSDAKPAAAAPFQLYILTPAESLKVAGQVAPPPLPVSLSGSTPPDAKTKPNDTSPSPLSFSGLGPAQLDGCQWTEAKVRQLISFYSEHSCLWNHRSESYRNRQLRQSSMETLSRLLSQDQPAPFTVDDIKTKFRNLRTIFQREHRAASSNKTCGSEDFYLPKWKHYRQLMFLCDSCDEDDGAEETPRFSGPLDGVFVPEDHASPPLLRRRAYADQDAANLNVTSPPSPTPPASQRSSPSPSSSPSTCSSRVSGHKRPTRPAPAAAEAFDFMRSFYQSAVVSPHAGFLKYVEECLNEAPPDKVKKLKMKIIETIHSAAEEP
ncbi:uncharacterized protein LOC115368568 [Myripristis murdjan]|uniref:uncharacterized protein LOC115368568 n=1 Tax=Myripristis murdjan TaxID=586833 RepID=UPI0011763905|nr:uncharacterized protein LOC115368568 [Myripristis murdjan]